MQLLCGDTDLGAEAELPAVGEAGGRVDHHHRGVHLGEETLLAGEVPGEDRFGVPRGVGADVLEGLVEGEVRNRIVMGSMHVGLEDSPADAEKLAAYLAERARGGAGLIVTGGYSPNRTGRLTPRGGQADEHTMERHRVITREVHEADGRIILQLLHAGRYAFHPLAASARAGDATAVQTALASDAGRAFMLLDAAVGDLG